MLACSQTPLLNAGAEGRKNHRLLLHKHFLLHYLISLFNLEDKLQRLLKENGGPYLCLLTK